MEQDKELEILKAKQLEKLKEENDAKIARLPPLFDERIENKNKCTNCGGTVEPELLSELKPGTNFCPKCVLMSAEAFVRSKSFMIEIASNKKKTFAKVREYDAATNQFGEQKIIDIQQMPMISVVGTIDFYKVQPMPKGLQNVK